MIENRLESGSIQLQLEVESIEARLARVEAKLWPPIEEGSGTGRYDHWTQTGDGKDYPGSYGVGELKPFDHSEELPPAEIVPVQEP